MIRNTKLPEDIFQRIPKAAEYLQSRPEVSFSYLFGSLAKDNKAPLSDVDIAVYLCHADQAAQKKLELLAKLSEILGTDEIDLVVLNNASLPLSYNILKTNKLLVDKDPVARNRHQSVTMRKYFDFHHLESSILKRRYLDG